MLKGNPGWMMRSMEQKQKGHRKKEANTLLRIKNSIDIRGSLEEREKECRGIVGSRCCQIEELYWNSDESAPKPIATAALKIGDSWCCSYGFLN